METNLQDLAIGSLGFIGRHGLWSDEQNVAAREVLARVQQEELTTIRLAYCDQHGLVRGKSLTARLTPQLFKNGADFAVASPAMGASDAIVYNPFQRGGGFDMAEMAGMPDGILVPDPTTFRILPWAKKTGWMVCDFYFANGQPMPFAPRQVLNNALTDLARAGYDFVTGVEIEFYVHKIEDPRLELTAEAMGGPGAPGVPPQVRSIARGWYYQLENHLDEVHEILDPLIDNLLAVGLPLRSIEDEWAPSQIEATFDPIGGVHGADSVILLRNAIKQICRRLGYHATFMCMPKFPGCYSSAWHLHQSLIETTTGKNAFMPDDEGHISSLGRQFIGGIIEHAPAACVFTTPTINGYRRLVPFSLAPDRAGWGVENRAAMIRAQGGPGDSGTHFENRVGESAANPYLYMASQIVSGLDGIQHKTDPGPPDEDPYAAANRHPLPTSLDQALAALKDNPLFSKTMGGAFVDHIITHKEAELHSYRTNLEETGENPADGTTNWEQRQYYLNY